MTETSNNNDVLLTDTNNNDVLLTDTNNNDVLLTEIKKISNIFLDNITNIDKKLDEIIFRVSKLENKVEFIENYKSQSDIKKIKELRIENIELSEYDILRALNYKDHRSILYIFKLYYKNKLNLKHAYPIRIKGQRSFEYYSNEEWVPDLYGNNIMNIICKNMENLFIKINVIEKVNIDNLLANQEFIYKLSNDKYKRILLPFIIEEVRLNNL
jgi:hypothetical protein